MERIAISDKSTADLLDMISGCPIGMPVRAMEALLCRGKAVTPALLEALVRACSDPSRDILWLVVLLGELRDTRAISPLIEQLGEAEGEIIAAAAAESLAKIGADSLPALRGLLETSAVPAARLFAYAALGWTKCDESYVMLIDALKRDRLFTDVIAEALTDMGRREAVEPLFETYRSSEPWQRPDIEESIKALWFNQRSTHPWEQDWRLRYRRIPALGGVFFPDWPTIALVLRKDPARRPDRDSGDIQSLEEIVAQPPERDVPPPKCESCGEVMQNPTGIPVCSETALDVVMCQVTLLGQMREEGFDDLFDVLDTVEDRLEELEENTAADPGNSDDKERREELELLHGTCCWFVEQGIEEIGAGRAELLAHAARLSGTYGDPAGWFRRVGSVRSESAKVGRNEPCPCGSGKKYKRCCLGKPSVPDG